MKKQSIEEKKRVVTIIGIALFIIPVLSVFFSFRDKLTIAILLFCLIYVLYAVVVWLQEDIKEAKEKANE